MGGYRADLIRRLASGDCLSGNVLAKHYGVTRTAIWKQLRSLADMGLVVERLPGRGYRLAEPFTPLCEQQIQSALGPVGAAWFPRMEVCSEVDSTSDRILEQLAEGGESGTVCLAEYQHSGRGRRGRSWHGRYGQNLCMSLLWRYDFGPGALGGLSLAVAVALWRALTQQGLVGIGIKWPNDLIYGGEKLAGILLEVQGESGGPTSITIGIGLNVTMSVGEGIDQPWCALTEVAGHKIDRNQLAAAILLELGSVLSEYGKTGFSAVAAEFDKADLLRGRSVTLLQGAEAPRRVRVTGVAEDGALLVQGPTGNERIYSGEVSVRGWQEDNVTQA